MTTVIIKSIQYKSKKAIDWKDNFKNNRSFTK